MCRLGPGHRRSRGRRGHHRLGSIDPLDDLADLAEEFGVHYHVDAAWGGALLFSRAHRRRLCGIERAHSVTIDAHKQMYLPIGIGLLLLRTPYLARAIQKSGTYILQDGSGDLGRHSVEGSRPGTSLFVHAALHIIGRRGYENLVNDSMTRAAFMARQIREREDFELLAEPETNIVLYRYVSSHLKDHRSNGEFTTKPQAREPLQYDTSAGAVAGVSYGCVAHDPTACALRRSDRRAAGGCCESAGQGVGCLRTPR
jgi:glutamate/tyrosine decarboxylase-like PLP-dependent enzyme